MKRTFMTFATVTLAVLAFAKNPVAFDGLKLDTYMTTDMVTFQPDGEYKSFELIVSGPNGFEYRETFNGLHVPFFEVYDAAGDLRADGRYNFEVRATPSVSADAQKVLRDARATGDLTMVNELRVNGQLPSGDYAVNGTFMILDGYIVIPGEVQEELTYTFEAQDGRDGVTPGTPIVTPEPGGDDHTNNADQDDPNRQVLTTNDGIIRFSLCVGGDCADSESFGSDTVRIKENNTRIHFDDTSASASFPNNDWRITANDTTNGGGNYLALQDATANTTPFRIDAGAGNNAIYVESGGFVGFGNTNPVLDLHVTQGNSPGLRLEQDGSSGFQSQIWDLAGNETNFFIRDVTNGSKLPFKVIPNAPTDTLYLDDSGNVGIGHDNPSEDLHIKRADASVFIEDTNTTQGNRTLLSLSNNGGALISMTNTAGSGGSGIVWTASALGNDTFTLNNNINSGTEFVLSETGDLDVLGSVNGASDVNLKENFEEVSTHEVLGRVLEMPISEWSYIKDDEDVRHIGPMAQDFYAAFGLGKSDKVIGTLDASGVAFASIQALHEIVADKDAEIEDLKARLEALEAKLLED